MFAANLTSSAGQPLYGHLADLDKARWLSPAGLAAAGLGIAVAGVLHGFWWIFAAVAVSGIGVDAYHPGAARAAHRAAAGRRSASKFSIYSLGGNAGFAAGPLLALPLLATLGLNGMVLLAIPALVIAAVFARRLAPADPSDMSKAGGRDGKSRWYPFGIVTFAVLARSVAFFGITTFLPL